MMFVIYATHIFLPIYDCSVFFLGGEMWHSPKFPYPPARDFSQSGHTDIRICIGCIPVIPSPT